MEISDSGESEEDVSEDEAGDMNIAGTDAADATTTGTTGSSSAASEEQERKKEQTRVIDWYDTSNPYSISTPPHPISPTRFRVRADDAVTRLLVLRCRGSSPPTHRCPGEDGSNIFGPHRGGGGCRG
jgi:hypothetical protein